MRNKLLKWGRVVVSLLFLTVLTWAFLDFSGSLSVALVNGFTWVQFIPSLLNFLTLFGLAATGFVVVMAVTLIYGRVYCSTVCPLGVLQDVISSFSKFYTAKIRKRRNRYRPSEPQNLLRYSILAVTVLFFLFGSVFFLNLLDPFSLFGKIFSGLVRPVYYGANNLLADVFQSFGNYRFYHVETRSQTLLPLVFPALMLGVLLWLAFSRGRLYCNTVCPVGTFLGFLSRYSMYRIEIDDALCNHCAKCSLNCKAECIDLKSNEIDFSRCVGCFNCLNVCSKQGIGYKNKWFSSEQKAEEKEEKPLIATGNETMFSSDPKENDAGRKGFLFQLVAYVFGYAAASRALRSDAFAQDMERRDDLDVVVTQPSTIPENKNFAVSPPGSKSLKHFTDTCTACQLCVSVCPTRVLQPSFLEYGFSGMMQPRLDFHASFCNFDCIACTEICPTGAILPLTVEEKHVAQIGVVRLELDNCVVKVEGTACGACAEHCPTQAVRMVPYQDGLTIPEIVPEQCIGCGACEYICPTRPYRAIYIDGNKVHAQAVPPEIEKLDFEPDDDFPF
ncbi:4Fe-4S dicluster domain-containing protein [Balneolaceae bacterium ANBcel3]|nr:4Fe-4S dicluster domain-containing protein [Balneolaceae bacterium ANBcel3]